MLESLVGECAGKSAARVPVCACVHVCACKMRWKMQPGLQSQEPILYSPLGMRMQAERRWELLVCKWYACIWRWTCIVQNILLLFNPPPHLFLHVDKTSCMIWLISKSVFTAKRSHSKMSRNSVTQVSKIYYLGRMWVRQKQHRKQYVQWNASSYYDCSMQACLSSAHGMYVHTRQIGVHNQWYLLRLRPNMWASWSGSIMQVEPTHTYAKNLFWWACRHALPSHAAHNRWTCITMLALYEQDPQLGLFKVNSDP